MIKPTMLLKAGVEGIKRNILPGLVLQVVALSLILSYFFIPPAREFFESVALLKTDYGFLFSAVSTAIFGGLLPVLYLALSGGIKREWLLREFIFYILFWAIKGIEVDAFYRFQGILFGTNPDVLTILKKMLVDQFIYSLFWATPMLTIVFLWKDCGFSIQRMKPYCNRKLLTVKIPSTILSAWVVWIPAVSVVYALPMPLQVPMFNIILCFWVLMLSVISKYNKGIDTPIPIN
jgi:hypothetical protein